MDSPKRTLALLICAVLLICRGEFRSYVAPTFANTISLPIAADPSGASGDLESATAVTLTGWHSVSGVNTAGNMLVIRLGRDGGNEATGCTAGAGSTEVTTSGPLVIRYQSTL